MQKNVVPVFLDYWLQGDCLEGLFFFLSNTEHITHHQNLCSSVIRITKMKNATNIAHIKKTYCKKSLNFFLLSSFFFFLSLRTMGSDTKIFWMYTGLFFVEDIASHNIHTLAKHARDWIFVLISRQHIWSQQRQEYVNAKHVFPWWQNLHQCRKNYPFINHI